MKPPKVFISYSHQGDVYEEKILKFANRLRQDMIDANVDLYEENPIEGWPRWMENQIEKANYVLLICCESYFEKFYSQGKNGKGISWEVNIVYQDLLDAASRNDKFIPVIFNADESKYILKPLKSYTYYNVSEKAKYNELCKRLKGINRTKPSLGELNPIYKKVLKSSILTKKTQAGFVMGMKTHIEPTASNTSSSLCESFLTNYCDDIKNAEMIVPLKNALNMAFPRVFKEPNEVEKLGIRVKINDTNFCIPYKELFGSDKKDLAEFKYNENISFTYGGAKSDCSVLIPEFLDKFKKEEDLSEKAGYGKESLDKLRLNILKQNIEPKSGNTRTLEIDFGSIDYFSHRIIRNWLLQFDEDKLNENGRRLYLNQINKQRANIILDNLLWPMCGCGVWIITSDDMLLLSRRARVTEEIGKLGYSAAGSCDRYIYDSTGDKLIDANPFLIIKQEIIKEVGLSESDVDTSKLKIISLGIDLTRCLIQFSFQYKTKFSAMEVIEMFNSGAQSSHEQDLFAVPFSSKPLRFLLENYEMESGAVYSLLRCIQKKE